MKKLLLLIFLLVSVLSVAKEEITVYGPESMKWIATDVAPLFKADTGIDINYVGIKGVVPRMKLEARRPKADVVIGLTQVDAALAKREGLIAPYKPATSENISKEEFIMDPEWYTTPFDYGAMAINYNAQELKEVPVSFEDIKKMDRSLILPSPDSSTGKEFMLWTIALYGDEWLKFWEEMKPAVLTVTPGWNESFAKFTAGEAPMMAGYASSSVYFYQGGDADRYASFIPSEGGYIYLEGASLVKKKEIKYGAKQFMDYILREDFQKMLAAKNYMFPVTDVELPEDYKYVPVPEKIVTIDGEEALENLDKWKKELSTLLKD